MLASYQTSYPLYSSFSVSLPKLPCLLPSCLQTCSLLFWHTETFIQNHVYTVFPQVRDRSENIILVEAFKLLPMKFGPAPPGTFNNTPMCSMALFEVFQFFDNQYLAKSEYTPCKNGKICKPPCDKWGNLGATVKNLIGPTKCHIHQHTLQYCLSYILLAQINLCKSQNRTSRTIRLCSDYTSIMNSSVIMLFDVQSSKTSTC